MNSHRLAKQLTEDEGLRLKPYRCTSGRLTIGVGRNLEDRGLTEAEAYVLLDNDIKSFWGQVVTALPWALKAPDEVQEVLVNMAFNLGLAGLKQFRQTLSLIEAGQYAEAAAEMLDSKWAAQVGVRAGRLAAQLRSARPPSATPAGT